ncbi:FtsJ-like methyltransferase [Klosneuvirus KNV1]|uniref:FtsJ-like methyltransferase n=1 Tax=Klosneuvirus KNV1 TaxID=1977640 RepID=A0A1V0SK85_9VIRU|nr:FtsJ-like methyltransferase [Klosneuvirus KNV1]
METYTYTNRKISRNIQIKSELVSEYNKKIQEGYIPYQTIDMKKQGFVRYIKVDDYTKFIERQLDFNKKMDNIQPRKFRNYDFSSDSDIHKMKRNDEYNYKYLIQTDPDIEIYLKQINNIINNPDIVVGDKFTFIPFLKVVPNEFTIEQHNVYEKIKIMNNKQFMENLKTSISPDKIGEMIYKINTIFQSYNNFFEILKNYGINLETSSDNIHSIIEAERRRIYGLSKERIANRLWERNEIMTDISKKLDNNCSDIDELYKKYFDELAKKDKIEEVQGLRNEIELCNAQSIMIDKMIDYTMTQPTTQIDFDNYYNKCINSKFAYIDTHETPLQRSFCENLLDNITNTEYKNNIKNILKPYISDKNTNKRCIIPYTDTDYPEINIDEYYMPEWYNAICDNKIVKAHNHRQLILGEFMVTNYLKHCSMIFRSDPFIEKDCDLPYIHYDTEFNKLVISCITGSDDMFPIRIINAHKIEKTNVYLNFRKSDDDKLLGSFVIKMTGERFKSDKPFTTNDRYYIIYVYHNIKSNRLMLTNFRSNRIIPGTLFEHIKMLYLELNILEYYNKDISGSEKLYYYKRIHDDKKGYDVYISKYDKGRIKKKYNEMTHLKIYENKIDELKETILTKNINKQFIFEDIKQNILKGGKRDTELFYLFDFKCYDYKWNINIDTKSLLFDKEIFSLSLLKKQIKLTYEYAKRAGEDVHKQTCIPRDYFVGVYFHNVGSIEGKDMIMKKKSLNNKQNIKRFELLNPNESILAYNFETPVAYTIYSLLNKILKPTNNIKYLIFSKNHYALDGIVYYQKYKTLKYNPNNFVFFAYEVENNMIEQAEKYMTNAKIDPFSIRSIMNNNWIKQSERFVKNIDIAIIDITIKIKPLHTIRYPYLLQGQLPPIILTLQKLNIGGTMILNTCLIPNKMVFNFITYLSCYFEKCYLHELVDTDLHEVANISLSWVVFENYKGNAEIDKLLELNKLFCELDSSGGYEFDLSDEELKKELNININIKERKYITNIIDIDDPEITNKYNEYKEYVKTKLLGSIRNFSHYLDMYINRDNKEYVDNKCMISKLQAVEYAKKYDLPLVDWINEIPEKYFNDIITNKIKDISFTFIEPLSVTTNLSYKPNILNQDVTLFRNLAVSESAYQYIEKINYKAYKNIEMVINSQQKLLNKKLQEEKHININGQYVSRAWIKFFELLSDIQLLKPYKDEVKVFHMCEAPGNFINSMEYFIKTKTKIKKYTWMAQSLEASLADFYDTYQFIKKTKNQWDLGPKKTGDILDPVNQQYYMEKYKDVDLLISDCGEKWTGEEIPDHENLSIYELYYALLIPKVGGSFVIKSFAANDNRLYISLLAIICEKYETVKVFKSNTNFWSPEVYIIGQNKKNISDKELKVLKECLNNLNQKKDNKYPIEKIPEKFLDEYNKIMYKVITFAADIKKFFVFLSLNQELFSKNKDNINKIIDQKNKEWVNKYII